MSIGSIGSSHFNLSFANTSSSDANALRDSLNKKPSSAQSNSANSLKATVSSPGNPPPNGPGAGPIELSAGQVSNLAKQLSDAGVANADKLNDLVKNFSQYDTSGNGTISVEQLKSYAQQNGVALPEPQARPKPNANISIPGEGDTATVNQQTIKSSVSSILSKYASSVSATDATKAASTTSQAPSSGPSNSSTNQATGSSQSSSSTDYTQKSDSDLQQMAAKGDAKAEKEIQRRKAAKEAKEGAEVKDVKTKDTDDSESDKSSSVASV